MYVPEVNLGLSQKRGRGRVSGPGNDASPERPRGSREEGYCPGSTNVLYYVYQTECCGRGVRRLRDFRAVNACFWPVRNQYSVSDARKTGRFKARWRVLTLRARTARSAPRWPLSQEVRHHLEELPGF